MRRIALFLLLAASASAAPTDAETPPATPEAATAAPQAASLWKDTILEGFVRELKEECALDPESMACLKYKLLRFVDQLVTKDEFQVSDAVAVTRSRSSEGVAEGVEGEGRAMAGGSWVERAVRYVRDHDLRMRLPGGAALSASAARLDDGLVDITLDVGAQEQARKSKLKKILLPVLVLVVLKAITLVPLFIGVLGLKAWNALQLSFFSFVISVAMAIFQLCRKLATDTALPHIAAPIAGPWEPHYGRGFAGDAPGPELAYRAHAPTNDL